MTISLPRGRRLLSSGGNREKYHGWVWDENNEPYGCLLIEEKRKGGDLHARF